MKLTVEMNDAEFISYSNVTVSQQQDGEMVIAAPNGWAIRLDTEIVESILVVGNRDNTPHSKPRRKL